MDTKKLKKVKDPFLRNKKRRKLSRKSLASLKRSLIANVNLASQQNTSKYGMTCAACGNPNIDLACDFCSRWFHAQCIGHSSSKAELDSLEHFTCPDCDKSRSAVGTVLYCVCRQPYDITKFYIGCDRCNDWFHGSCIGINETDASKIDTYICAKCRAADSSALSSSNQEKAESSNSGITKLPLTEKRAEIVRRITKKLAEHKMAWPFLKPVNLKRFPNYTQIVPRPIDLGAIEKKLERREYEQVGEWLADVRRVFENCRAYNAPRTPVSQCAQVLEVFFDSELLTGALPALLSPPAEQSPQ